jgi:excisionase family DNA binding protein
MDTKYLTREEAADYLGVSLGHLAELLKEPNPLPAFRLGRRLVFRSSDIDRWIEIFRVKHSPEGLQ